MCIFRRERTSSSREAESPEGAAAAEDPPKATTMFIFKGKQPRSPGVAESPEAAAAADDLLKGVTSAASGVVSALNLRKAPAEATEGQSQTKETEPEAEVPGGSVSSPAEERQCREARREAELAIPANPEDPYQGPVTSLKPKVGRLSCRQPIIPAENVIYAHSLAKTTTDMLETVNHLAVQVARLVKLQQAGGAPFQPNSHVIAILTQMEQALWTHSTCQGLLNNVQRIREETYAEIQRAYRDQVETLKGVDVTVL